MLSGWCIRAKHARGVANTLTDGICRWERENVKKQLREYRRDIKWQEQDLGPTGMGLYTAMLASCSFVGQLQNRHIALSCHLSRLLIKFSELRVYS